MPDKYIGGDYLLDIKGLGDGEVNRFIGTQWKSGGKLQQLKTACDDAKSASLGGTYINVRLELR